MLRHTVRYEDFEGKQVEEEFYFNLTEAELAEMELTTDGGMLRYLEDIVQKQDAPKIVAAFKEILLKSIGQKSEDGRRFHKSQMIRDDFVASGAYSVLFMQLVTDAGFSSQFVNGIMPAALVQKAAQRETAKKVELPPQSVPQFTPAQLAKFAEAKLATVNTGEVLEPPRTWKDYTSAELMQLDPQEFQRLQTEERRRQGIE